ncbi:hypothetical protein F5B22DRAFT_144554 [Xylaria bambusicola]|uniref:uncharacterized protein n=1 Tax=Xylaria bambusicola TaxID=326684 RepID=UPI0020082BCB|nr:uncharacterized protein F5B22DRAFT_144554 [Xylaria bambusicola]KAI0517036.1 hypothetical protein F5B22DRAFT_144554 [Xylaria bambusicola]
MLGSHRDNANFNRAGWRKRVMLPCWIIQILILLSVLGLFSYRLSHTVSTWKEEDDKGNVPVVEFVWAAANIAFSLVSLLVTFISIARFIAEVLTPLPLLFGCILNMILSAVVLALDIVIYVQRRDRHYSLAGLGLDAALIIFTIIPLIYAIIIYRRLLNYDDYHLPYNHKAFGFAGIEEGVDDHRLSRVSTNLSPPTPYDPTNPGLGTITTITGGEPQNRGRSVSIGSRRISLSFSRNGSVSPHPSPPPSDASPMERRTSYDHRRDTQFEDYVARRASQRLSGHSLQDDVNRALGDEFGFTEHPSESKGETVTSGAVHAGHASRPRVSSIGRQTSYEALVGGTNGISVTITTPPEETIQRGHSLNSVPEAHEEEDHRHEGGRQRKRAVSESQRALLGDDDGEGRRRMERVAGLEDVELEMKTRKA